MSISASSLKALQQAGQALRAAAQAVGIDVQSHSHRVMEAVALNPFSPELDQAYGRLRSVARMVHELTALEDQLKTLFQQAGELSGEKIAVMVALPNAESAGWSGSFADQHAAQDVVAKAPAAVALGKRSKEKGRKVVAKKAKTAKTAKATVKTSKSVATGETSIQDGKDGKPEHLTPNDVKVLESLKTVLNRRSLTKLTHTAVAQAAGIPSGSVGIALRHLIDGNMIVAGDKGAYRLT